MTIHGWIVVGSLAATAGCAALMGLVFKPAGNGLDLQLPRTLADLQAAVGATEEERRRNHANTVTDLGFLTAYTLLFVAAGSLLARQGPTWAVAIGSAAAVAGVLTGLLDVLEDLTIFAELRPGAPLQELYGRVRRFSIRKWFFSAVTNGLLVSFVVFDGWNIPLGLLAEATALVALSMLKRAFR